MKENHKLNSIIASNFYGKTEEFKRPNHPDFMVSSELKTLEWTGLRSNEVAMQWEFWILGEIRRTVTFAAVKNDPSLLGKAHVELFAIIPGSDALN